MSINSYRDLQVWQEGMDLAVDAYTLTQGFPKHEAFGMTSQIRRAATSIPANIAEGYSRDSRGEYLQFLRIAQGSLKELETHLLLAERVELCLQPAIQPLLVRSDRLGKRLHTLIRTLQKSGE
jgi:four helix bundle protein